MAEAQVNGTNVAERDVEFFAGSTRFEIELEVSLHHETANVWCGNLTARAVRTSAGQPAIHSIPRYAKVLRRPGLRCVPALFAIFSAAGVPEALAVRPC
jgi:hypothetical protein